VIQTKGVAHFGRRSAPASRCTFPPSFTMTWKRHHPTVECLEGVYPDGVRLTVKEMRPYEARLHRSAALPKYDIVIKPDTEDSQVK
jgi:hypothetical protein